MTMIDEAIEEPSTEEATDAPEAAPAETNDLGNPLFDDDAPETETTETEDKGFLDGKYESKEAMEDAYRHLEKAFHEKHEVPEKYEIETDKLSEYGLRIADEGQYNALLDEAKVEKFSQSQIDWMLKQAGQIAHMQAAAYGPQVDKEAEHAELRAAFGDDYESVAKDTMRWASQKFGRGAVTKPLGFTADGLKLLHALRTQERGPNPVRSDTTSDPQMTEASLMELIGSADFHDNPAKQRKAEKLQEELIKARGERPF